MSSRDPELFTCSRGTVIRVSLYIIFMLFIVECVNFSVYTKTYNIFKSYQRDNENSHTQLIKTGSLKTTTPKARVVEPPTEQRRVYKRICEHYELTQENVQCEPRAKCPKVPPNLVGPLANDTSRPSYEELTKLYPWLEPGGRYAPKNCIARYKVAVIIPFRDRDEHLRELLYNLHPVLRRQQKDYGLFVIEQTNGSRFNRAMLMNIGFTEAVKLDNYTCFIFHDVDLIPEDDRIIYDCSRSPRHLSFAVDKFNYKFRWVLAVCGMCRTALAVTVEGKSVVQGRRGWVVGFLIFSLTFFRLPYPTIFGGVTALSRKDFEKVNGYSNKFFGWGGEDDDMFKRIRFHGLKETRYPIQIARYRMIRHKREKSNKANKKRIKLLHQGKKRYKTDGINNLHYTRLQLDTQPLFTRILVKIDEELVMKGVGLFMYGTRVTGARVDILWIRPVDVRRKPFLGKDTCIGNVFVSIRIPLLFKKTLHKMVYMTCV